MEAREYKEFYEEAMHAVKAIKQGKSAQVLRFPNGEDYKVTPNKLVTADDIEVDRSQQPDWVTDEIDKQIRQGMADVENGFTRSWEDVKRDLQC